MYVILISDIDISGIDALQALALSGESKQKFHNWPIILILIKYEAV